MFQVEVVRPKTAFPRFIGIRGLEFHEWSIIQHGIRHQVGPTCAAILYGDAHVSAGGFRRPRIAIPDPTQSHNNILMLGSTSPLPALLLLQSKHPRDTTIHDGAATCATSGETPCGLR